MAVWLVGCGAGAASVVSPARSAETAPAKARPAADAYDPGDA